MRRVLFAVIAAALVLAPRAVAQPLPTDPRLVSGTLENGVRYMIRQHGVPPGRGLAWLRVNTGSLNETEKQRGAAHFLEHVAFYGSENFKPETVVPFFESLGMTFGADLNARTTFNETLYTLSFKENTAEMLDRALLFLRDVAGGLTLDPAQIERERRVVLEEKRARLGPEQRIQELLWERLAPGSVFSRRLPIGTEESIAGLTAEDFGAYYRKWYVGPNMTVIVVADMDPAVVEARVRDHFGPLARAAAPTPQDPGAKPYEASRAIVVSDDELTQAQLFVFKIDPPRGKTTTEAEFRAKVLETITVTAFNRRIDAKLNEGKVKFTEGSAFSADLGGALQLVGVGITADPKEWREALRSAVTEVERSRRFGLWGDDAEDAKKNLLSQVEQAARTEATRSAQAIVSMLSMAAGTGDTVMSSEQQLELLRRMLPTITKEEASAHFRTLFDTRAVAFVAALPSSAGVPTEEELLALGVAAVAGEIEEEAEVVRPSSLLANIPAPGKVVEQAEHEGTQVVSAWLENGTRVHYRFSDYRKDEATVTVALAGGIILETGANRGVTEVATLPLNRPATSALTSTNIRDLLAGKSVGVGGGASADAVVLSASGNPADLETGMQVIHLLLTDPVIERPAFDQWKQQQLEAIQARKMNPQGVFGEAMMDTMFPPGELRVRALEAEQVERLTVGAAQEFLRNLAATAPLEVSIVGDIPRERAMELVATYVGSLPARARIGDATLDELRTIPRLTGPISNQRTVSSQTKVAVVMSGFYGSDAANVRDTRLLTMAAQILSTRMTRTLREQEQLVYSIQTVSEAAQEFPGFGLLAAFSPTDPEKASRLAERIGEMLDEFAKTGPTEEELANAKRQITTQLEDALKEPRFWTSQLSILDYRGRKLDELVNPVQVYQGFTTEDVRETFARYARPENRLGLIVKPAADAPMVPLVK